MVGFDHNQWEDNRRVSWVRYQAAIPRLSTFADIGDAEKGTFSVERVLDLKPELLITLATGCAIRAQWNSECAVLTSDGREGREAAAVMHRQLKQTAFFVADRARKPYRHLGRHYHAPGRQRPLPDVEGRVVVGWRSNAAADALELDPGLAGCAYQSGRSTSIGGSCSGGLPDRPGRHASAPCIRSRHEVRGSPNCAIVSAGACWP